MGSGTLFRRQAAGAKKVSDHIMTGPELCDMQPEELFTRIEDIIRKAVTPVEGMRAVFGFFEPVSTESDWRRLHGLTFEADLLHLNDWLTNVLTTEPPSTAIDGLWFGLF